MEKFAPVKRSEDGQVVRYLIVDDSVFARKNLAHGIIDQSAWLKAWKTASTVTEVIQRRSSAGEPLMPRPS